jgi:hypothetical protein
MDDLPFKYLLDNSDTNEAILNIIERKDVFDYNNKFENYNFNQRSFLKNNFEILNPPNF